MFELNIGNKINPVAYRDEYKLVINFENKNTDNKSKHVLVFKDVEKLNVYLKGLSHIDFHCGNEHSINVLFDSSYLVGFWTMSGFKESFKDNVVSDWCVTYFDIEGVEFEVSVREVK